MNRKEYQAEWVARKRAEKKAGEEKEEVGIKKVGYKCGRCHLENETKGRMGRREAV